MHRGISTPSPRFSPVTGGSLPEQRVALDATHELYTVLYTTVVCGGAFFFQGFRPSIAENHCLHRLRCEVVLSRK